MNAVACIHRGQETKAPQCPSCPGNVRIKVFRCAKHSLCSISKQMYQVVPGRYQVCETCPDRFAWVTHDYAMGVDSVSNG